jgi:predicted transcriptional regulator
MADKINYIEQINGFWEKNEDINLKSTDIAVYFAILKYSNDLRWANPFVAHWEVFIQFAGVSKNTFYKSIKNLNDIGLIKYKKGMRNKVVGKIEIVVLKSEINPAINSANNSVINSANLSKHLNKETFKRSVTDINEKNKIINSVGVTSFTDFYFDKQNLVATESVMIERLKKWLTTDRNGTEVYREKTEVLTRINDGVDANSGTTIYKFQDSKGNIYPKRLCFEEKNKWYKIQE